MKTVKFLMSHTVGALYNEGETAGFDDAVADDLIEREIAEEVKQPKKAADDAAKKANVTPAS
jgi:uncharacterized membrane protein